MYLNKKAPPKNSDKNGNFNLNHSTNTPENFRVPAELFGKTPEMDLALEKKLLSNLKKHSNSILQPIDNLPQLPKQENNPLSLSSPSFPPLGTSSPLSARSSKHSHSSHLQVQDNQYHPHYNSALSSGNAPILPHPHPHPYPPQPHSTSPNNTTSTTSNNYTTITNTAASTTSSSSSGMANGNLLTALTQRLTKVEEQAKNQQSELFAKDMTIQRQQSQMEEYQEQIKRLIGDRQVLRNQIEDMEVFLNDYGLVWVGNKLVRDDAIEETPSPSEKHTTLPPIHDSRKDSDYNRRVPNVNKENSFELDVDKLKQSIMELNITAGEGTTTFEDHNSGHNKNSKIRQLKDQPTIPITIYKNGFMLFSGPFRHYSDQGSHTFINDLYDGYFPYELKDRYPNGVLFKIADQSDRDYVKHTEPSRKPRESNIRGMTSLADRHSPRHSPPQERGYQHPHHQSNHYESSSVSTSAFLQKLPASTIRNGRVVDVRQSVSNIISGPPIVTTNITSSPRDSQSPAAHIKVRLESGDVIVVRLHYEDTIQDLRAHVDKFRSNKNTYEIRSAFPQKVFKDLTATLVASGLTPNATVIVK